MTGLLVDRNRRCHVVESSYRRHQFASLQAHSQTRARATLCLWKTLIKMCWWCCPLALAMSLRSPMTRQPIYNRWPMSEFEMWPLPQDLKTKNIIRVTKLLDVIAYPNHITLVHDSAARVSVAEPRLKNDVKEVRVLTNTSKSRAADGQCKCPARHGLGTDFDSLPNRKSRSDFVGVAHLARRPKSKPCARAKFLLPRRLGFGRFARRSVRFQRGTVLRWGSRR